MIQFKALLILFISIVFAGCSTSGNNSTDSADTGPSYGDIIVSGSASDAINLIPVLASDYTSRTIICDKVYNGLIKLDKNLRIAGDLAESWDVSNDGLVLTFHLRKNVKWHDGHPFTADDVLYTYKVTVDPKTPTVDSSDFLKIKIAEVIDPYTFRVTYKEPFAPALTSWGAHIMPKHLLEGRDITKSPLSRNPVGTGPFKFKEWVTGTKIVLVANEEYFEGRPFIDAYIMRVIPDRATMFLELRAGGIHKMNLTPLQYSRQTQSRFFENNFKKYRHSDFVYSYLGFNLANPLFKDIRVRQAMAYAIDKQEIIQGVLLGYGKPATGPFLPEMWAYNPNVRRYDYDPGRARELLKQAGWSGSESGVLMKDGKPFVFEVLLSQGSDTGKKTAEIMQMRFAQMGIQMKIRVLEWAALLSFINNRIFDAVLMAWAIPPEPDPYSVWHSSKTAAQEQNFISYKNSEVDELLQNGRNTFNIEERKRAYFRLQEILAEEQPYIFLFVPDSLPILDGRIRGIDAAPAGIDHNFIKWYIPKSCQKLGI